MSKISKLSSVQNFASAGVQTDGSILPWHVLEVVVTVVAVVVVAVTVVLVTVTEVAVPVVVVVDEVSMQVSHITLHLSWTSAA
jgi:hypothetical protein